MTLPDPMMPPGVDLRGHEWFPFYPDRLRKSRWWRRASDLARARNIMLWGEAFKSVPAGSLPDDDDELAEAAGFGMDAETFIATKTEIMAAWTLCSDGRWYHPVVCEMALNAWERMDERRRGARERQARRRARTTTSDRGTGDVTPKTLPVTPAQSDVTRDSAELTRDPAIKERRGEERDSVASAAPATGLKPWEKDNSFRDLWALAPASMKRRSSQKKTWPEYREAVRLLPPEKLITAYRAYLAADEDLKRTGGPGLHIWLKDQRWEAWVTTPVAPMDRTDDFWRTAVRLFREQGRWSDELGPAPGQPGCQVPARLSIGAVA